MNNSGMFIKRIKAIPKLLKSKDVSLGKKILLIFGIVYLVLPFDLIPPFIPVFGWLDDVLLWIYILRTLRGELDRFIDDGSGSDFSEKYKGKNVIDASFTEKQDGEEGE